MNNEQSVLAELVVWSDACTTRAARLASAAPSRARLCRCYVCQRRFVTHRALGSPSDSVAERCISTVAVGLRLLCWDRYSVRVQAERSAV